MNSISSSFINYANERKVEFQTYVITTSKKVIAKISHQKDNLPLMKIGGLALAFFVNAKIINFASAGLINGTPLIGCALLATYSQIQAFNYLSNTRAGQVISFAARMMWDAAGRIYQVALGMYQGVGTVGGAILNALQSGAEAFRNLPGHLRDLFTPSGDIPEGLNKSTSVEVDQISCDSANLILKAPTSPRLEEIPLKDNPSLAIVSRPKLPLSESASARPSPKTQEPEILSFRMIHTDPKTQEEVVYDLELANTIEAIQALSKLLQEADMQTLPQIEGKNNRQIIELGKQGLSGTTPLDMNKIVSALEQLFKPLEEQPSSVRAETKNPEFKLSVPRSLKMRPITYMQTPQFNAALFMQRDLMRQTALTQTQATPVLQAQKKAEEEKPMFIIRRTTGHSTHQFAVMRTPLQGRPFFAPKCQTLTPPPLPVVSSRLLSCMQAGQRVIRFAKLVG